MTKNIFVSVGRTATTEQERFVSAVEELLREHGFQPRTVGRTDFATGKPLAQILEVMQSCSGTIIIAFERFYFEQGTELRGSLQEVNLTNTSLPTVWNQIEAAMAYTLGQPILTIVDSHLHSEGLLEDGYDWFIGWVELEPKSLQSESFMNTYRKWKEDVEKFEIGVNTNTR